MPVKFYPRAMTFEQAIAIDHNAHGHRRAIYVHGVPYAVRNGQLIRAAW
jgi:hypothetical protein